MNRRAAGAAVLCAVLAACSGTGDRDDRAHLLPDTLCGGLVSRADALAGMGVPSGVEYEYVQRSPSAAESGPVRDGYKCVVHVAVSAHAGAPARTATLWVSAQARPGGAEDASLRALAAAPGAEARPLPGGVTGTSTRDRAWAVLPGCDGRPAPTRVAGEQLVVLAEPDSGTEGVVPPDARRVAEGVVHTAVARALDGCPARTGRGG